MNFTWKSLPKPFFALAPMEDVTDTVFRRIVAATAPPDVFFGEFTNTDGMFSAGDKVVNQRLRFTESERPLIAQIWGIHPENFYKAALKLCGLGFDGIDINFGCPQRNITKDGACSAMIKTPTLAAEIIAATRKGIVESNKEIPLSVKTRIGINKIQTEEWIGFLLGQQLNAITVHGRTAKEMSKVPCHWDEIGKAVQLRNSMKVSSVIIGNGDVKDRADGLAKAQEFGVDGIMIGRGIFHNPWAFEKVPKSNLVDKNLTDATSNVALVSRIHTSKERFELLIKHVNLFVSEWGSEKHFPIMKKFVKMYVSGFDGASAVREQLMETKSAEELLMLVYEKIKTT